MIRIGRHAVLRVSTYASDLEDQLRLDCNESDFKESKEARIARKVTRKLSKVVQSCLKRFKKLELI